MGGFTCSGRYDNVFVTLGNIPNDIAVVADIFVRLGAAAINVDMISQTVPYKKRLSISFTVMTEHLAATIRVMGEIKKVIPDVLTEINLENFKLIIQNDVMQTMCGVAGRAYKVARDNGFTVKMITTSENEVGMLFDNVQAEEILNAYNKEFMAG